MLRDGMRSDPGLGLGVPRPTLSKSFQLSSRKVRLGAAKSLSWPSNNPEGRNKTGMVPMDAASFPKLRHVCAKIDVGTALVAALHGKSHFCAGTGLPSVQKRCCSRGGR